MNIRTVIREKRGCGYRKEGAFYFAGAYNPAPCGKLPLLLTICPCCGSGLKFSRSVTWFSPAKFFNDVNCIAPAWRCSDKTPCSLLKIDPDLKSVLMWVGEKFYNQNKFIDEAINKGICKRIPFIPREFKLGTTRIFLAMKKIIENAEDPEKKLPAIFCSFVPQRIEYIIKPGDPDKKLKALEKRGVTLIKEVEPQTELLEQIEESTHE